MPMFNGRPVTPAQEIALKEITRDLHAVTQQTLTLKWGTVKGWTGAEPGTEFRKALDAYFAEPVSISAMLQNDTDHQKKAIIAMIDACEGTIYSDWSGNVMTKDEAKAYVLEYKL